MDYYNTTLEMINKHYNHIGDAHKEIRKYYPDVYKWVFDRTSYLPNECKFSERLYHIYHGVTERPHNRHRNKYLNFVNFNRGYGGTVFPTTRELAKIKSSRNKKFRDDELEYYSKLIPNCDKEHVGKVRAFLFKRQKVGAYLYAYPKCWEGIYFVACPVLNVRLEMITNAYIENCLNITKEEYSEKYNVTKFTCDNRITKIKKGIHEICPDTGLEKYQIGNMKRDATLKEVDENGLRGYDKIGIKTKETHMVNTDENGLNGYQRLAKYRNETIAENGNSIQKNALLKRLHNGFCRGKASKISKKVLSPVLQFCKNNNLKYYFDDNEYCINTCDEAYFYDLVIPELKLAIEYDSLAYHPSIYLTEHEWKEWKSVFSDISAEDKHNYDTTKAKLLFTLRGFIVWNIYENENVSEQVNMLMNYIKENCHDCEIK